MTVYEVPIDLMCTENPEREMREWLESKYPDKTFDMSQKFTAYTKREYNVLFIEFEKDKPPTGDYYRFSTPFEK